jgi:hypothetical protein
MRGALVSQALSQSFLLSLQAFVSHGVQNPHLIYHGSLSLQSFFATHTSQFLGGTSCLTRRNLSNRLPRLHLQHAHL